MIYKPLILIPLLTLLCLTGAAAREKRVKPQDVPDALRTYVQQHFAAASRVRYYREKAADSISYEALFRLGGKPVRLISSQDGTVRTEEYHVSKSSLPQALREHVSSDLAGRFSRYRIQTVTRTKDASGERYQVWVWTHMGSQEWAFTYSATGQYLSSQAIPPASIHTHF